MTRLTGIAVQDGVSIGPIRVIRRTARTAEYLSRRTPAEELARFEAAKRRAVLELKRLQDGTAAYLSENEAAIFMFHSVMLDDMDYLETIYRCINDSHTAESAIKLAGDMMSEFFASRCDSSLRSRAADARDVTFRLDDILVNVDIPQFPRSAIVASEELCPSTTAALFGNDLLGLVSRYGSEDSHSAILARAAGIPAVTGIEIDSAWDGHVAILNGGAGVLTIDPDQDAFEEALELAEAGAADYRSGRRAARNTA